MSKIINTLSLFIFISFFFQGTFQQPCYNSDIVVTQKPTGEFVGGKPEYTVTFKKKCVCTMSEVLVTCGGFQTAEPVPPQVLAFKENGTCLVNDGNPIPDEQIPPYFTFKYAWDAPFTFKPKSFQIACS